MNKIDFNYKKDPLFQELEAMFPRAFYVKFKKIIIYLSVFLFLSLIIYAIVNGAIKNQTNWWFVFVLMLLFFLLPLILTTINWTICLKKFQKKCAQNPKIQKLKIKINQKKLYLQRGDIIQNYLTMIYHNLKQQNV